MKNKKGYFAQFWVFLIFVGALILFAFSSGTIGGFLVKKSLEQIPTWFWILLGAFILLIITKKKK